MGVGYNFDWYDWEGRVNEVMALQYHKNSSCISDMYTFDTHEKSAMETYETVCQAYCNIFDRIGVPYQKGK